MELSVISSTSWLARAKNCFGYKKETVDKILMTVSTVTVLASCLIPVSPIGAITGACLFALGHKVLSLNCRNQCVPRTWTQLAVGLGMSTAITSVGFSVPVPFNIYVILFGPSLGLFFTYSKHWECTSRLAAAPTPHDATVPDAPPPDKNSFRI